MKIHHREDGLPLIGFICVCGHSPRTHVYGRCQDCACRRFRKGRSAVVARVMEVQKHDVR